MRISPSLRCVAVCLALTAGGAGANDSEPSPGPASGTPAALVTRHLSAVIPQHALGELGLEPLAPRALPRRADEKPFALSRMLELELRGLAGPQPPDPRRFLGSGNATLRLPLGDSLDLRPGVRLDYVRHPVDDLWTGEPIVTIGLSMHF
ncbi:MAG: hypothetical protein JRH16_13285 [Deltaproteobacteria bacterium]|nr:hypothetical protein [Deltaproteobacteria bacterium]MBW2361292.1 hypothetical protein [Deltaproteobacteria bacterium]